MIVFVQGRDVQWDAPSLLFVGRTGGFGFCAGAPGAAFSGIVTALTDNFINPMLQAVMKGQSYSMEEIAGFGGNFLTAVVNFFITALVLFCLLKAVNKMMSLGQKKEAPAAPTTKQCPYCCSEIPIAASRCPHCTSQLEDRPAA